MARAEAGALLQLFGQAGARRIDLPVLQPADPFLETAGEAVRRRMFVTEGATGERLCLRPDFTIPVALAHIGTADGPARYAYEGLVFRRGDDGAVEERQAGVEDYGDADTASADARVLGFALSACRHLGASPSIQVGDQALFDALLAALELPAAWRARLSRAFGGAPLSDARLRRLTLAEPIEAERLPAPVRDLSGGPLREALRVLAAASGVSPGVGRSAEEIAERYETVRALSEERLDDARRAALSDYLALEAPLPRAGEAVAAIARRHGIGLDASLGEFAARADALAEAGAWDGATFAAAFGRPLDYYTGLVFELGENGRTIAGGGRYDKLLALLGGEAAPAVGFTLFLDRFEPS